MTNTTEYTYLTLPPSEALRSCIGLVVAGMAARARIGVGGLEEAVELLEDQHSSESPTRYRFSFDGEGLLAEVEEEHVAEKATRIATERRRNVAWRTVVELVA